VAGAVGSSLMGGQAAALPAEIGCMRRQGYECVIFAFLGEVNYGHSH